jgi:hypothetical protein
MPDRAKAGFTVVVADGDESVGSVRRLMPEGRRELVVYIENGGDFVIPFDAVKDVHFGKLVLDRDRLDERVRAAIDRARDAEDG